MYSFENYILIFFHSGWCIGQTKFHIVVYNFLLINRLIHIMDLGLIIMISLYQKLNNNTDQTQQWTSSTMWCSRADADCSSVRLGEKESEGASFSPCIYLGSIWVLIHSFIHQLIPYMNEVADICFALIPMYMCLDWRGAPSFSVVSITMYICRLNQLI